MRMLFLFILASSYSLAAMASDCTGGQQCSTNNVKHDFRIYSTSGFEFNRDDNQEHHVTYQALEIVHHGLCAKKYCPVKYRLKGDEAGQYRTGYIHQNGFRDRGATATGLTQLVDPTIEGAPESRDNAPVPMPRLNREEVRPTTTTTKDQIDNVKKDFRIYSSDDFKFRRDGSSVENVTRNATEMIFMGECHRKYCLVKYKIAGDNNWREGYVHQNGFLDRGASAKESSVSEDVNVATPEVIEEQPQREPVEETQNRDDNNQVSDAEKERQRQAAERAAQARQAEERRKAAELAEQRKKAQEEAERKRRENTDPCIAELRKNVCANNLAEVKSSKPLMCKLRKMGGNENSIFRKFYDEKMGVTVEVKTSGQYSIRMGIIPISSGNGQVCLSSGDLRLKAGDVNMKLNNLNRIRHKYGEHDLDLVAQ